jgi:type IV pilus assembly protein PilW
MMISLALGLLILLGVYTVYQATERGYAYLQGLVYLQENAQIAAYLLRREISMAGYAGCRKVNDILLDKNNAYRSIRGDIISTIKNRVPATDAILIGHLSFDHANLLIPITTERRDIAVSSTSSFKKGNTVIIADCQHANAVRILDVTGYSTQWLHITPAVTQYDVGAYVGAWRSSLFYIGKTGRSNNAGDLTSALYIKHDEARDEELIENVDDMQVRYGVKNKAGKLVFYTADHITDWQKVQAVMIHLLLDSGASILTQPQHLRWLDKDWIAPDRRLYKTWTIVIGLPNQ